MKNLLRSGLATSIVGIFLNLSSLNLAWAEYSTDRYAKERSLFLQAEAAAQKQQWQNFKTITKQLEHYPLYPYLLFKSYENNLDYLSPELFLKFVSVYKDTPLSEEMRMVWLNTKAKQENWRDFLYAYTPSNNTSLKCQYLWAELQTNRNPAIFEQVKPIWLSGKPLPRSCDAIVSTWIKRGHLDHALAWQRIKLSIQDNQNQLAKELSAYLNPKEKSIVNLWIAVNKDPNLIFNQKLFLNNQHPAIQEMLVHGMSKIAQKNPEEAVKLWPKLTQLHQFSQRHWSLIVRAIGIQLAKRRHPDAMKWLVKIPTPYTNDEVHEWRVRLSLFQQNWPETLVWLERLPTHVATQEIWQYWRARTLDMLKRPTAAQAIFNKLSENRSYYGFLAAQKINKQKISGFKKTQILGQDIQSIAKHPGILRARELWLLGRNARALKEWIWVTKHMEDKQRQAAAKLALHWDLPNWSIMAFAQAKNKDQLELRFPTTHAEQIFNEALRNNIDPAWIFAITRQESAFVPTAKSSAGALGLMQLMPSTARMVAKKSNLHLSHSLQDLFHPRVNLHLGSRYLKMMLEYNRFNPILATAAYNAGPGRIKQWLPTKPISADTWIETIPFLETREYVKNVLTYTLIYQQILGNDPRLKSLNRLPHVNSLSNMNAG